ncbi:esterase family protein [Thiothrix subterranea]|uniref:Alpha/beta hydrolase-fold protein n=1 Tax=Thiothrix subterranea TaxID=2735563 RepID=A0AA51MN75_9GAMM|nr:alpha/beta hydrolase-fold protein [Thiothrix subterranea]MDQ5768052.1 alpha/beta hydrolase-fold protein [Thiothrix subterranea]WML85186.1 alpha/beta hydrolase-fold protein [Thiothrix subterranea]
MQREYHRWHSPRMGRTMELLVFGHAGAKVLVFPTRDGRFDEYEKLRIVQQLAHKINAGQLQLFCVDSVDHDALYCFWKQPAERIRRHMQFEDYILHKVLPFMQHKNQHPCTIAHGCSLGAFHAANIAFRHPHLFQKLSAFSGRYDLTMQTESFSDLFNGYYDDNIYFHTPTHFLPNLQCEGRLQHLRQMDIVLVIGKEDPFLGNNHYLSQILHGKGIRHQLHEWHERAHRGYYWRRMAPLYV